MKQKNFLATLFCFFFTFSILGQTTYYVASDGVNNDADRDGQSLGEAWASLGYTISRASNNDTIIIDGSVNQTAQTFINDANSKSLTIRGQNNATITGDGSNRLIAVTQTNTQTWSFEDITFQNISSGAQGSVFNAFNANLTVSFTGCNFLNNSTSASAGGGAVYVQNATATFTNCNFYKNSNTNASAQGGALHNQGSATVTVTNSTFYQNSVAASGNFNGAAIRVSNTSVNLTINNSLFYDNTSGNGSNSDINSLPGSTIDINNSLAQYTSNVGTHLSSDLSADFSNTTFTFTSPNLTYGAPSSINDDTPIDFGSDKSDVGAWDSKINLFKAGSDWATGTNWSSTAAPTSLENVTLLSDSPALVIGGSTNATINNLSIDGSSSLTINSGGSLIVNGTSTGNVTYNRNLATTNWYLVSSPFAGETMTSIRANNTLADGSGDGRIGFAPYDDSQALGSKWTYFTNTSNDALANGKGYSAKLASAGDISFTGTINTTDVSVAVSNAGTGFNLIGNPYTSHLTSATFLTDNSANLVSQTLWVWNGSIYETKVTGDSFVLAPAQGFFVRSSNGTNINIAESYQASTGGTFQKSSKTEVKLIMNDGSNNRFVKMYYLDNATKGFDNGFDGETFGGIENTVDVFTNLIENNDGKKFQVQSLPIAEMETIIVPVGVKADAGKEITFTAEAMNLPRDTKVFLEDRFTNTITRLDEANTSYKVTLNDALNGTGRFFLHTKASGVLSTDEVLLQNTNVYATSNNTLRIVGLPSGNADLKMYNILGKQVLNTSFKANGAKEITLPRLASGVYIVQLLTESSKLNKKIILE
ncbi:T9SS type A sorting domain-containing protein [Polaribacter tangerinus]|uniref:T9SS type A sorting domain-containing protein n=1 Tax=Polaribacter tangerinus TaxID=1920034 RepID=UPI000B4B491F|nr:T9SS type A sorting domain-containing protein [Polaribacter tangerinus]